MKKHKILIISLISLVGAINLTGCTKLMSSQMPVGSVPMTQTYNEAINGTDANGNDNSLTMVREKTNDLITWPVDQSAYELAQGNEKSKIDGQFQRLSNPDVVMYVYPHLAGQDNNQAPVPGYTTAFPLYQHEYYAMPGEVVKDN